MSFSPEVRAFVLLSAAIALPRAAFNAEPQSEAGMPGMADGKADMLSGGAADSRGVIYIVGRVVLEDGSPPPSPAVVQSNCGATARGEAYTDASGRFSVQFGASVARMLNDAATGAAEDGARQGGAAPGTLAGCQIWATLPGFASERVNLSQRNSLDNPNVGSIRLRRLAAVEGLVVSATSLSAPKKARRAFEKGLEAERRNKLEDARKNFESAVGDYPAFAAAWCELGRLEAARQAEGDARRYFETCMQADPRFLDPYISLARLQFAAREWEPLLHTTERAVKLDPYDYPLAHLWNAVANYNLGSVDAAERSAWKAEELDRENLFPAIRRVLGLILASGRKYGPAAAQLRMYLKLDPGAADAASAAAMAERCESLAGQAGLAAPASP